MARWHHQCNGHEFEQTLGDGEEQGSPVCYNLWGCKEADITEWLNNSSKQREGFSLAEMASAVAKVMLGA